MKVLHLLCCHQFIENRNRNHFLKKLVKYLELSEFIPIFAPSEHLFWLSGQNPEGTIYCLRSKTSR